MGRSLLVDMSANNTQNVMQNVCTIVAKKAALKKERIKNTPFAEDAYEPFVPFIENVTFHKR
jgi:hypothetical protein